MSWINGRLIINDLSQKSLQGAYDEIKHIVRSNTDLEEFPNRGEFLMEIKDVSHNKIFNNEKEAESYIRSLQGWSRNYNIAVAFRDTSEAKETKKIESLTLRKIKVIESKNKYAKEHQVTNYKAAFITCPKCNSKINKNYIYYDKCPVCRANLQSQATKDALRKYDEKAEEITKVLDLELDKQRAKLPVKYLIAYEEYIG